jgi:hypothetical protein
MSVGVQAAPGVADYTLQATMQQLLHSHWVGHRVAAAASVFLNQLPQRLSNSLQLANNKRVYINAGFA